LFRAWPLLWRDPFEGMFPVAFWKLTMNKVIASLLLLVAAVVSFDTFAARMANAQGYSDDDDYRYRRRHYDQDRSDRYDDRYSNYYRYRHHRNYGYEGCRATIRATGIGYPIGAFSRNSAIKAWRREAQAVYGRDFSWSAARGQSMNCEPYLATLRCTATARPCA
jgi:hypothetical protein